MKTILRILGFAKPWRWAIIGAILAMLGTSAVQLLLPMVARELLARIATPAALTITVVIWLSVALAASYLFRILFQFLYDYLSHRAALNVEYSMRKNMYRHIQEFSPKWFLDKSTGAIAARVNTDCARLETLIAHCLPDLISSCIMFFGSLGLLLYINPLLTAFLCIPMPLILIASFFARRIRKQYVTAKALDSDMVGDLTDNIQGMKEIQVFNRQHYEAHKIGDTMDKAQRCWQRAVLWRSLVNPLVSFMHGAGHITIILVGGILAYHGHIAAADLTAFILYIGMVYMPLGNLARILEDTQDSLTSGKRIFEILDTKTDIYDRENAQDVGKLKGNIVFDEVSFIYDNRTDIPHREVPHILKDVSFKASANKTIALVGPTGAGKTTVANILCRFFDVHAGKVTIDGIDIRDMTLKSLRNNISIVLQDVFLFNGTIGQNIGYGKDGATQDEIVEAARKACIHDFILTMPQGYDTVVGERGTRLSGGQKQRVVLARAILRCAPILILDEATSAIDNTTEEQIQKAINQISGERTMVVIAHRLSTIMNADQILYLEDGRVKEQGTYKELMAKGGAFAKLASR